MRVTCATCRWLKVEDETPDEGMVGECRHALPTIIAGERWGQWPKVVEFDWCSHWEAEEQ